MGNMNIDDPAKQEQIRRGPHRYEPTEGKHGAYVPMPYVHSDYPKQMATIPAPQFAQFKGQPNAQERFDLALREWDTACSASIVKNRAEEQAWLKAKG